MIARGWLKFSPRLDFNLALDLVIVPQKGFLERRRLVGVLERAWSRGNRTETGVKTAHWL